MSDIDNQVVDTTQNEPAPAPEPSPAPEPQLEAGGGEPAPEPAPWEPVFTYKVRDEEHEFDERTRQYIKTEDDYKHFQDLYTRGHGLELAKSERDEYRGKFDNLNESLQVLNELVQRGDAENFIRTLGLPEKMFMDYAINRLKYQELPPEEKAKIDAQKQQQMQMQQLQYQNDHLTQQYQNLEVQQKVQELDNAVSDPGVAAVAQDYDARMGTPGAFKNEVIAFGESQWRLGNQMNPAQAAMQVAARMQKLGIGAGGTQPNLQTGHVGTQPAQQVSQQRPPVIPNIQGRGTSPTKKIPKSIDDLRNIYNQRTAGR